MRRFSLIRILLALAFVVTLPAYADALGSGPRKVAMPRTVRSMLNRARLQTKRMQQTTTVAGVTFHAGTASERTQNIYDQTRLAQNDVTKGMRLPIARRSTRTATFNALYRDARRGRLNYTRQHQALAGNNEGIAQQLVNAGVSIEEARNAASQVQLGLPSNADTSNVNDLIMAQNDMVFSYNDHMRGPNWVSWTTTAANIGKARVDDFREDIRLPSNVQATTLEDYAGVHGRLHIGHLLRSKERSNTNIANSRTFVLTNTLPQAQNSNVGPWLHLETMLSNEVEKNGKSIHVIAGAIWGRSPRRFGRNGVAIPQALWKIAVVLEPGQTPADINENSKVYAAIIPNSNDDVAQTDEWTRYQVSVRDVERATGYQFMTHLSANVANHLRDQIITPPAARQPSDPSTWPSHGDDALPPCDNPPESTPRRLHGRNRH